MGRANVIQSALYVLILLLAVAQTAMHIFQRHWDTDGHFGHQKIVKTWAARIGWAVVGILLGLYCLIHLIVKTVRSSSKFVSSLTDIVCLTIFLGVEILAIVLDGLSVFSTADIVACLCGIAILGTLIFEIVYVLKRKNVGGRWSSSIKDLSGW